MKSFVIDVVIAWVDGNDENHAKKLAQYIENKSSLSQKGFLTRYLQVNEIEYCIKSIRKFAPYVKTIHIVTDEQVPSFLTDDPTNPAYENVKVVDHKVIFKGFEHYLPTFNCYPIETLVYRIPDLAEHFIYFNDDMFLINETKPSDFFTTEGYPVLRGKWSDFETGKLKEFLKRTGLKKKRISKITYKKAQENSAKILGLQQYFKLNHTPFPMRKSVFESYFENNPDVLNTNIQHRFRDPSFFMVQAHAAHLELMNSTCETKKDYSLVSFGSTEKSLLWIKNKFFLSQKINKKLFLNIQSLDMYSDRKLQFIKDWFERLYK
jgi:hypothetical protein